MEDLRNGVVREQSEKADLETALDEQRRRKRELEGERNRQEGTIAKQASEIKVFKNARKKCEDELKCNTEVNEAQRAELGRLTEEIKVMKAKEDPLMEEVSKLKEEIRQRTAQKDSLVEELAEAKDRLNKFGVKEFAPSVKKVIANIQGFGRITIDAPDGIIAHLARECGGNVYDRRVVDVTSGSFEKETYGANPHSWAYDNRADLAAKNAADLETDSEFLSAFCLKKEDTPHMRNNWICYDFKERRIAPTHYTIHTNAGYPGGLHLKVWLLETSTDGQSWREIAREQDSEQLNRRWFTGTFAIAGGGGAASSGW
jgi:hypothetical protein